MSTNSLVIMLAQLNEEDKVKRRIEEKREMNKRKDTITKKNPLITPIDKNKKRSL